MKYTKKEGIGAEQKEPGMRHGGGPPAYCSPGPNSVVAEAKLRLSHKHTRPGGPGAGLPCQPVTLLSLHQPCGADTAFPALQVP